MIYVWCILIGYLIGCINPAYLISKIKKIDIRKKGSGNLGATNTSLIVGKKWGALVMAFDIFKAYATVKLCQYLFAQTLLAGVVAGSATILGHNHPFYLKFKGGKGLAAFGGCVLALNPLHFLALLIIGIALSLILDYGIGIPLSASILFPTVTAIQYYRMTDGNLGIALLTVLIILPPMLSVLLRHRSNWQRIKAGTELRIRDYFKGKSYEE